MTKEWYKNNGYALSVNIEQSAVDRAEHDAFLAYVKPILPTASVTDEGISCELAALAYMLLLQRTLKVTRSGTKQKTEASSMNANEWTALSEQATTAAFAVSRLREKEGAVIDAKVDDIAKIYFKTNFFCN